MENHLSTSQRLHEDLEQVIARTKAGERLPSEPTLARRLGVSRATLREAMRTFETQGLLSRRQGIGTFVTRPPHVIDSGLEVLESIETLARRIGLQVTYGDLMVECVPASQEEANALGLLMQSNVMRISRVILTEGRTIAYLVDVLPKECLFKEDVEKEFTGSVLDMLLKDSNLTLTNSRCEICAVAATKELARALKIRQGDALLKFVSRLYALDGRVVDYSYSYFLPGYFRFHVVRELSGRETYRNINEKK
jgi:GntR family transcriptional regulator